MSVRVMHYVNQFFAGIGGEDKANVPVGLKEGAVGPGKRLQELLGDTAEIVVTAYCGDDYFAPNSEEALASVLKIAKDYNIEMLIAGPAFNSGRHGFACAEVCHAISNSLDVNCVTGMHINNPGIETYKQYKDRKVYAFPTTEVVSGMGEALSKMALGLAKLATSSVMGPASEDGYVPRGIRVIEPVSKSGAQRAIDMLLDKRDGRSFTTEIPLVTFEAVPVPHRIENLKDACIALINTVGIIPPENPDGIKSINNTKYGKYPIDDKNSMKDAKWDVIHGGYDTQFMKENPNYGIPLDAMRILENEGSFARLYPYFYSTAGAMGTVSGFQTIGQGIARDLKAEGVDATILVSA